MTLQFHDLTPRINFAHPAGVGAGTGRARLASYVSLLPPCNHACPAGEDIQGWLALAQAGRHEQAWRLLVETNPLPAVHGRVCYHPCETSCNRSELDAAVSIHAVERYLGDLATSNGWQVPVGLPTGRRVLVVGSGPAGLSAAWQLRRLGHAVEIREAASAPGGMLQFGIPAYRLPRDELMKEIRRIEAMDVRLVLNAPVDDVADAMRSGGFAAAFLAIGAQIGRRIDIPGLHAGRVFTALELLGHAAAAAPPSLGRRVVVYGAGNTAMDAARTARRLGADDTTIVFFSDRAHMEAQAFEAAEAASEGIRFQWLSSLRALGAGGLQLEHMVLDAQGVPQPTGQFETLPDSAVVLALGQQSDTRFLHRLPGLHLLPDGSVTVGADMMTGAAGIFAGGDLVPGPHTVTSAVGQGARAARAIDGWLGGQPVVVPAPRAIVHFAMLNLPLYADTRRAQEGQLPVAERLAGFAEVTQGLAEPAAREEAQRCLSCGNCFECDHCYAACPEDAIERMGPGRGYRVDPARCTGCAVCADQCPCHAIDLLPRPVPAVARPSRRPGAG